MLRKPSLSTLTLANSVISVGSSLTAVEGTPLASLVEASMPLEAYGVKVHGEGLVGDELQIGDIETALQKSVDIANMPLVGQASLHQDIIDDAIDRYSTIVNKNIALARSIVNPLVHRLVEDSVKEADLMATKGIDIEIIPVGLDGIWKSQILYTLANDYSEGNYNTPPNLKLHPSYEDIDLSQILDGVSGRLNTAVEDWVSKSGLATIEYVWRNYFSAGGDMGANLGADFQSSERALAMFVIALALKNKQIYEPPISDIDYQTRLEGMLYYTGAIIVETIRNYDNEVQKERVVTSYPMPKIDDCKNPSIMVNGTNYEKFLDAGGQPEILFGAYLTDKAVDGTTLSLEKDKYLAAWNNHIARIKFTQDNNRVGNIKSALRKLIIAEIETLEEEFGATGDSMYAGISERIDLLNASHLDNLYPFVRAMVCDVMYPATEAKQILMLMDDYGEKFPDLPPRELGLLATAYLVSTWVASMMIIKKAN